MRAYIIRDNVTTGGFIFLHLFDGFVHLFQKWWVIELRPNRYLGTSSIVSNLT